MKFNIENGSNHISIELSDTGDYFRFDNPLVVTWPYDGGTVGKYFCALPYSATYRDELRNKIAANLNNDFTGKVEELYSLLTPLLLLFKNGEYSLEFFGDEEKEFFKFKPSGDPSAEWHYIPVQLVFGDEVDVKKIDLVKRRYEDFVKENEITKQYAQSDIFNFTTSWIYDGSDEFYATQPFSAINQERVSYFEKMIKDGERPLVMIMNAKNDDWYRNSSYYVLDGHHKLLAYQKLAIHPPLVLITYFPDAAVSTKDFDFENLATALYPWQMKKLLKNWYKKDTDIAQILKNPDSPLHKFIKNGLVREYHENKQLKHEAYYNNDQIDGNSFEWYDNGQLKHEYYYNKGIRAGTWRGYYRSGKIEFQHPFNKEGRYDGELILYYESGGVRSLQKMKNSLTVEGYTNQTWFENGVKESELKYKNGVVSLRKNWNSLGHLISYELYDAGLKKMVKQPLSVYNPDEPPKKTEKAKDFGIIRERQYPVTGDKGISRIMILLLIISVALLRTCR